MHMDESTFAIPPVTDGLADSAASNCSAMHAHAGADQYCQAILAVHPLYRPRRIAEARFTRQQN